MGLVRGSRPLGGFPATRLDGLDVSTLNEKLGMQLADCANAAPAVVFPPVSISPPAIAAPLPLPVPALPVFSSSLAGTIPCSPSLSTPTPIVPTTLAPAAVLAPTSPMLASLQPVQAATVAQGCPTSTAYPLAQTWTAPIPCAATLPTSKAQAACGFVATAPAHRVQPVLHVPTMIRQTHPLGIADVSIVHPQDISPREMPALPTQLQALEDVEQRLPDEKFAFSLLPLRLRLSARRPAPHSRRLLRRPRRARSVVSGQHFVPSVGSFPYDVNEREQYLQATFGKPTTALVQPEVLVWRCRHPHGLFSMFSLALGHIETCEKQGLALLVDWSSEELLYRGPPGEPNVWNAFFCQPAELKMAPEALRNALSAGRYKQTSSHRVVYGSYKGVIQDYGGIPPQQAAQGRALCRKNIVLRPRFQEKLQHVIDSLPAGRRLAVHIRRSDKKCEAKANFELSDEDLHERIVRQCAAWQMDGVLLCTDDAALKQRLTDALERAGLSVSTYDATLPTDGNKAVHFDKSVDAYKKAEDVVMEAFLMAKGCHGLLSTYSNVSASVVYLSDEEYPYTTFWDTLQAKGPHAGHG